MRIGARKQLGVATVALGVAAVLGLSLGPGVGAAPADRGPVATASAKFCKKHPRKPRCRRLRLAVSWDDDANIDLYVWDAALRQASPFTRRAIPRAIHGGDTGVNPEKFFDARGTARRPFAFGICLNREPAFEPTNYTVTYVRPDGSRFTDTDSLFDAGQSIVYLVPGVPDPDPTNSSAWCPPTPP